MRRGFPINSLLTAVVVALIVVAAGGMALSAYQSMTRSLDETWDRLAGSMAERTMQEANFLLALAGPAGRLSEETVDDGGLDPKDHEAMLSWLEHGLEAECRKEAPERAALMDPLPREDAVPLPLT